MLHFFVPLKYTDRLQCSNQFRKYNKKEDLELHKLKHSLYYIVLFITASIIISVQKYNILLYYS